VNQTANLCHLGHWSSYFLFYIDLLCQEPRTPLWSSSALNQAPIRPRPAKRLPLGINQIPFKMVRARCSYYYHVSMLPLQYQVMRHLPQTQTPPQSTHASSQQASGCPAHQRTPPSHIMLHIPYFARSSDQNCFLSPLGRPFVHGGGGSPNIPPQADCSCRTPCRINVSNTEKGPTRPNGAARYRLPLYTAGLDPAMAAAQLTDLRPLSHAMVIADPESL
jgi:hypothetical protein